MSTKGRVYKIGNFYYPYIKKWYHTKWHKIDSACYKSSIAIECIFIHYPNIEGVKVIEINYSGYVDK